MKNDFSKRLILSFFLMMTISLVSAQTIVGKWKTIDDNTGKPRSIVQIFEEKGEYLGKIIKLFREPGEDQDPDCKECKGNLKNKKIIGLQIINNLVLDEDDNEYVDGSILDPENGKVYDCKLWLEDGKLKVRGYVMFLYRTQTWLPHE